MMRASDWPGQLNQDDNATIRRPKGIGLRGLGGVFPLHQRRLGLLAAYISQPYLRYAVRGGKHGLESVVHADVVQDAHGELLLALVSCNKNRPEG